MATRRPLHPWSGEYVIQKIVYDEGGATVHLAHGDEEPLTLSVDPDKARNWSVGEHIHFRLASTEEINEYGPPAQ